MRIATVVPALCIVFVAALAELVTGLASPVYGLLSAALIGVAAVAAGRKIRLPDWPVWAEIGSPLLGTLLGAAVAQLGSQPARLLLLAPLLSAAGAGAVVLLERANSRSCSLCSRHLTGDQLAFDCPRCGLLVCEARCWSADRLRCRLCLQNQVPVFVPDEPWWEAQLGRRCQQGACQNCHADASERDLRSCRRCGRPQCRECWDDLNGACVRCQWTILKLPESLARFVQPAATAVPPRSQEKRH